MIPDEVTDEISGLLESNIKSSQSISGGSINQAAKIVLSDGRTCFLKWNRTAETRMFEVEEKGLGLLSSAKTDLRIPTVYATGDTENGVGFLVQEFIEEGRADSASARTFGKELAKLHKNRSDAYGLNHDNYIGRLPQSNNQHKDWVTFFIDERMEPQLSMAIDSGKLNSAIISHFENMYKRLPDIFPDERPSLLHGDLWGGNYFYDESGAPTIYDPAVYYGHREIEIAFTHLFGGFSGDFYAAYNEALPMAAGFQSRKDIYNLYPLLVHTNLFGGSYARQVRNIVNRF